MSPPRSLARTTSPQSPPRPLRGTLHPHLARLGTGRLRVSKVPAGKPATLALWEKLLFTRDFHDGYHHLQYRDDFQSIFAMAATDIASVEPAIERYARVGFRPEKTGNLQPLVCKYLTQSKDHILTQTYYWGWKQKMHYALYKYETHLNAEIRDVMKSGISVEHMLSQTLNWDWFEDSETDLTEKRKEELNGEINGYIHGLGNLLLITRSENSSLGNEHPARKDYGRTGGSYTADTPDRARWLHPGEWKKLIKERGERVHQFMMEHLLLEPEPEPEILPEPMTA